MKPRPLNQPDDQDEAGDPGQEILDIGKTDDLEIDRKWVQLAQLDIEKFDFLYRKYRPKIFLWIMWMVKIEDVASNLTDETFSQAVDNVDKFKWRGYTFGAWLFKIARTVVGQYFRRKNSIPEIPYDPDLHEPDTGKRPDLDLEREEESHLLMMCLDRLKPDCREVMVNYYGLGMTTKETGLVMDMAEATVKSHLQRGRKQLKKALVAEGMERELSPITKKIIWETAIREDDWDLLGADNEKI